MGIALLIAANGNNGSPSNAVINISGGGGLTNSVNVTAQAQLKVNVPGTFSNLTAVNSNIGGNTGIETIKNGAAGNQSASVVGAGAPAATFGTDAVHTDTVVAGDLFNLQFSAITNTAGAMLLFTAASGHSSFYSSLITGTVAAGTTKFVALAGGAAMEATENTCQIAIASPGTISGLHVFIKTNAATTGGMVVTFRKNGAAGVQTFVVAAGVTGLVQVSSLLTDTVAVGDLIDVSIQSTGTSAVAITMAAVTFTSSATSNDIFNYNTGTAAELAALTQYHPIGGDSVIQSLGSANVESLAQVSYQHGFSGVMSGFSVPVLSNTYTNGVVTLQLIKNGANANQVITIPFGQTGLFQDLVHSDAFGPTDTFAVQISTTGTGTKKILINSWTFSESPSGGGNVWNMTVTEAGSAADSPGGSLVAVDALAETGSAADVPASKGNLVGAISESGSAADITTGGLLVAGAVAESGSAADAPNAALVAADLVTESGTAADAPTSRAALVGTVAEVETSTDAMMSQGNLVATVPEAGTASDTVSVSAAVSGAVVEAGNGQDAPSVVSVAFEQVTETADATDSFAGPITVQDAVSEAGSASDAFTGGMTLAPSLVETGDAMDSWGASLTLEQLIAEMGASADLVGIMSALGLTLQEAGAAQDTPNTFIPLIALPRNVLHGVQRATVVAGDARARALTGRARMTVVQGATRATVLTGRQRVRVLSGGM
jgi:hypothetical protein